MRRAIDSQNSISPSEQLYAELLEEITARVEAHESVDVETYIRQYPQFSARIRAAVPALQALQSLGVSSVSRTCTTPLERGSESAAVGDFRLVRQIGRGGMGVVFEAEQISLGRHVALKILPFAALLNERQLERFATEATAAARLQHPHIVPIYTVGCERGIHFYAMQLIDGPSLAEVIAQLRHEPRAQGSAGANAPPENRDTVADRAGTLLTRDADGDGYYRSVARIGRDAAEALQYAHEQGVLHRDIKPSNLLLDAAGHVWIADFGLARVEDDSHLTRTGDVLGTLRYMSPEQATGERDKIDARSDVYSLGATLYELLTLRPPYAAADPSQLLRATSAGNVERPRRWDAAIPEPVDRIAMRAIARKPSARYATAQELADDLRRFLDRQKVRAPRPPLRWHGTAWLGRHRRTLACALVLSAAAVVAVAYNRQPTDVSDDLATRASDTPGARVTFLDVFVEDSEVARPGTPREVQIGPDGGIYVTNTSAGEVVRMDPDTAESNVFIPSGRGGLNTPHGLAWDAAGNVYVSSRDRNEVLRYSRSGAFDRVFVSAGRGGLNAPAGLAFGADANGDGIAELHVSSSGTHSVMRFDGATGEPFPGPLGQAGAADLVPPGSGGLRQPQGMCLYDGHIYVASFETAEVLRYDMISGEFAGVATERPCLASVEGVAVWEGQLYVNNRGTVDGPVLRFDLTSGASEVFVQRAGSGLQNALRLACDAQGRLYVGSSTTNDVLRFDRSGRFDGRFPRTRPGVPRAPRGLLLHGHSLFVCSSTNEVLRYDMVTGEFSGAFISAQSGLDLPVQLVCGPDANDDAVADVYVSCFGDNSVRRFDGISGLPIGDGLLVRPGAGGLDGPVGLAFRNQTLYVASWTTHQVLCYESRTGDFLGAFVAAGAGGLRNPSSLVFGDDRHLYVSSDTAVLRYDALTGAPLPGPLGRSGTAEFVPAESGGLVAARGMALKSGHLYVVSGRNQVVRYDALTGRFDGIAADADSGLSRPVDLAFEPGGHGLLFVSNRADDKILRYRFVLQK